MADLSIGLLAHNESLLLGPTLRSLEAAIAAVQETGASVELLLGLDNCDARTRDFVAQPRFDRWRRTDFALGDQGRVRNELARMATGGFMAFVDADDLYSENWFAEGLRVLREAEAQGLRRIARPELNWLFDAGQSLLVVPSQDDPLYLPEYLLVSNPYDALCMAPRRVWLDHPYADRAVAEGYAYEDWQWAIETTAAGWTHVAVRDTIIFKRRRDTSQTVRAAGANVHIRQVPGTAIDEGHLLRPDPARGRDGSGNPDA
ncbi:glycosyltransferase family A protein [uncultured Jannaschia sp.]|uniref:glycosyltransferase family A protein n=1 Tax=uncultured Jannaschia sp. TaxID=293347 RepID=UPI00262240C6|nr:glycosyltransferase family A protein [uncultured Jannaschia sp.]